VLRLAGCVGDPAHGTCHPSLIEVLAGQYGKVHEAILYEPAPYAVCEPLIRRCRIGDLADVAVTAHTILFVPPNEPLPGDPRRRAAPQMFSFIIQFDNAPLEPMFPGSVIRNTAVPTGRGWSSSFVAIGLGN